MQSEHTRASDSLLVEVLQEVKSLSDKVTNMDSIFRSHVHDEESNLKATAELIGQAMSGFPGGDPKGHCEAHLADMQRIKDRAEFWKKMTFELSKLGIVGFAGWVLYAFLTAAISYIKAH